MASSQAMLIAEKLFLRWNDYQDNINNAFASFGKDIDFVDVTLACQDIRQFEAHKVILVASSPFCKNLLKRNKHSHPLIYMKGVKQEDLSAIVEFLYYGETNINQENLDTFLNIAEELELNGLAGEEGREKTVIRDVQNSTSSKENIMLQKNVQTIAHFFYIRF